MRVFANVNVIAIAIAIAIVTVPRAHAAPWMSTHAEHEAVFSATLDAKNGILGSHTWDVHIPDEDIDRFEHLSLDMHASQSLRAR